MADEMDLPGFRPDPTARTPSYRWKGGPLEVDGALLNRLSDLQAKSNNTTRLCLHPSVDDALQEMIVVQSAGTMFPPKKNLTKSKSFLAMRGELAVILFNDEGRITTKAVLRAGGWRQMIRVPPGIYHCDISLTPTAMHLESIPGPFVGHGEHIMAPWAPDLGDENGIRRLYNNLVGSISRIDA